MRSRQRASSRSCSRAGRRSPAPSSAPVSSTSSLLFVAPTLSGSGPGLADRLDAPLTLAHLTSRPVGDDVLLEAYVREP